MKRILFILAIAGLILSSCGNKKKKEQSGYHTHEDGTVHRNDAHSHENDAKPQQESFEVAGDDDRANEHEHGDGDKKHSHDNDERGHDKDAESHKHGEGSGHDHDHEHSGDHK